MNDVAILGPLERLRRMQPERGPTRPLALGLGGMGHRLPQPLLINEPAPQ